MTKDKKVRLIQIRLTPEQRQRIEYLVDLLGVKTMTAAINAAVEGEIERQELAADPAAEDTEWER